MEYVPFFMCDISNVQVHVSMLGRYITIVHCILYLLYLTLLPLAVSPSPFSWPSFPVYLPAELWPLTTSPILVITNTKQNHSVEAKELSFIRRKQPEKNRDGGYDPPAVFNQLLRRDPKGSHDKR